MENKFTWGRALKIGLFHLGSALADILTASVWNRILITDLHISATPVALMLALRYLLAPVSIWVGQQSDTRPILGWRRLPYIWIGRLFMLAGLVLLPLSTLRLVENTGDTVGWLMALLIFVLYGLGTAVSGGPYLALIHDSAPAARRGVAITISQIILIVGFATAPVVLARLLPSYSADRFQSLAWMTAAACGVLWLFSVAGEERRVSAPAPAHAEPQPDLVKTLRDIWADARARGFFFFLALGAIASFAQDAILEPFGGDVFGLSVQATTRFSAYFGSGVLVAMLITSIITRRRRPEEQAGPAVLGMAVMIVGLALLATAGVFRSRWLLTPALLIFGLGFGVYTVGGVSLLMAMTTESRAGAYMGLWTMTQLVSRGAGIGLGGVIRDAALALTGVPALAYAGVFALEGIGLAVCIGLLLRLDVAGFARERPSSTDPVSALALAD